jgi:hypothetical protein
MAQGGDTTYQIVPSRNRRPENSHMMVNWTDFLTEIPTTTKSDPLREPIRICDAQFTINVEIFSNYMAILGNDVENKGFAR